MPVLGKPIATEHRRYHAIHGTTSTICPGREAAGTNEAEFVGATVSDVLNEAIATFGTAFADVVAMSKVWVNGEEVPLSHHVGDNDEVAVLPPVSGGM